MVINEHNSAINSFTKGMNSDGAYDQLDGAQYTFAQNVRITKNQFLGGKDDYASVHEGIIAPVPSGLNIVELQSRGKIGRIIAVKSIDNMAIIISTDNKNMNIYRIDIDETTNQVVGDLKYIWHGKVWPDAQAPKQVSAVLYKELQNVIKLYIATGKHPIICVRVDDGIFDDNGESKIYNADINSLINNREIPRDRVFIQEVISGRLTTSQVQYTYRYYNKYGNSTQLAPLTNKIQVIDSSRAKETGNAENTETAVGFSLIINNIDDYYDSYNRLQIFRLQYVTPGADAEAYLIYDGDIKKSDSNTTQFEFNDIGVDPLQQYTMEEFAAMSGIILIPQVIEQNQEYMFCGNVVDDTIIQPTLDEGTTIDLVKTPIVLSTKTKGEIPDHGSNKFIEDLNSNITTMSGQNTGFSVADYLNQRGVNPSIVQSNYEDIFTSSLLRSLRRGEIYKYAVVFYDKYGRRSDVMPIGDREVSPISDSKPFDIDGGILKAYPIGVKISVPQIKESDIAEDIIGCQIVRRTSSEIYQSTLLQVALARPVQQGLLDINVNDPSTITEDNVKKSPFYPTGFLSSIGTVIHPTYYKGLAGVDALNAYTRNSKLFQIFSSEIDYRRDDVLQRLSKSDINLEEVIYIPSVFAKYTNSTKSNTYNGTLPESMTASTTSGPTGNTTVRNFTKRSDENYFVISNTDIDENARSIVIRFGNSVRTGTIQVIIQLIPGFDNTRELDFTCGVNILTDQLKELMRNPSTIRIYPDNSTNTMSITTTYQSGTSSSTNGIYINRDKVQKLKIDEKQAIHWIFNFYSPASYASQFNNSRINQVKDVKIPDWNSGFDQVQRGAGEDGDQIATAIKKYRSFTTNIDSYTYNNWISFGKYDLRPGCESEANQDWDGCEQQEFLTLYDNYTTWLDQDRIEVKNARNGYIGPGPSCFLISTKTDTGNPVNSEPRFYTSICNITHTPKIENVQSDEFTAYYGFGNYFKLKYEGGKLVVDGEEDDTKKNNLIVFDGDIYITPHEFTTMYKTYNFESIDTLQSTQVTNYIPLESKVNTYFDYGMNLRNTNSENLLYEPGSIDSITTQERPAHQYNMIYSDNDASNDVFTLISTDKNETNNFKQRTYYSELKNNGEFIDNFLIFKPASFIDVDSKYGEVTNLLTDKNTLYYWQDTACGKFSVNERSLINDQNNNTIMLGQAGILSRYDYLTTKYGMRKQDLCAVSTDNGVYYIDINNKAIVLLKDQVVNYGEQLNVQNIINNNISSLVPKINYDLQNNELLCKCLNDYNQIIFNIKYGVATSLYTRRYDYIIDIKNHQYGIRKTVGGTYFDKFEIIKYNYLPYNSNYAYLSPLKLEFIVNPSASVTKVFDSQQMIPIKRDSFANSSRILNGVQMAFETDITSKTFGSDMEPYTDREGNIIYNIPRFTNELGYGCRIRGKWMRVEINNNTPTELFTLSHVVTKFRQSFS